MRNREVWRRCDSVRTVGHRDALFAKANAKAEAIALTMHKGGPVRSEWSREAPSLFSEAVRFALARELHSFWGGCASEAPHR